MTNRQSILAILGSVGLAACESPSLPAATQLYMDVHELGPGKVTAGAVAKAHTADLGVQGRHGVRFLHYWVDEKQGKVYCLSQAPGAEAIVETHREAHGLLPSTVGQVSDGE
jgi:hypothetical protein